MKKRTKVTIGVATGVVYVFVRVLNALLTHKGGGKKSSGGGVAGHDSSEN